MSRRWLPLFLLVLLVAPILGGCAGRAIAYEDAPIELAFAGPVAVDVETFGGDVVIASGARDEGVSVKIVRRALHGRDRDEEAERSLDEIDITVDVIPGSLGPIVRVRATTRHAEPHFQRADVYIEAPDVDGVRVLTGRGLVLAKSIRGALDVETRDGYVRVITERPMMESVTIINHRGDIDYRVRPESTGDFDCRSLRGRVQQRTERGRLVVHSGTDGRVLRATLNDGINPVMLRAADGDIRIAVVPDPMEVGNWIKF